MIFWMRGSRAAELRKKNSSPTLLSALAEGWKSGYTETSVADRFRSSSMPKRTFQPNRRHRAKTHGFLSRMKSKNGAAVLSRRRAKGRHKIAVSAGFRD